MKIRHKAKLDYIKDKIERYTHEKPYVFNSENISAYVYLQMHSYAEDFIFKHTGADVEELNYAIYYYQM